MKTKKILLNLKNDFPDEVIIRDIEREEDYVALISQSAFSCLNIENCNLNTQSLSSQLSELKEVFTCLGKESLEHNEPLNFTFVYFSWRKCFYKILSKEFFYELLTWRNKNKINASEQFKISNASIAIVGCSVGSSISKTLAKVGVTHLKIAESKYIKPSNSSRLSADSLCEYGEHKLSALAKSLYEYNPYINLYLSFNGVEPSNLNEFVAGDNRLVDIVIDASDGIESKVALRDICKSMHIPLISGWDERGVIEVERNDVAFCKFVRNYPLMDYNEDIYNSMLTKDFNMYVAKIMQCFPGGHTNLSSRSKETLELISQGKLGGVPQLAWEASLLASQVTKAVINIVLDKSCNTMGVYMMDLNEILGSQGKPFD
ncbi:ThiF family adenylyltransferase [Aeromonas veronii]|uniref:ThiF family adenylyltransferase n=1 Tax=Aeromonas veronii TaxID=654 RepID=UPI001302A73B|nr:ThiF family adenylyltransferase [Aeromonas veronii]KAE9627764.1 hypothetical protein GO977_21685 [Aeromonas veronii]